MRIIKHKIVIVLLFALLTVGGVFIGTKAVLANYCGSGTTFNNSTGYCDPNNPNDSNELTGCPYNAAKTGSSCPTICSNGQQPDNSGSCPVTSTTEAKPTNACGSGTGIVYTSIDFGCKGDVCAQGRTTSPAYNPGNSYCTQSHNAVLDGAFAIIQFLSAGVGVIVVASIILAGIQYSSSRDNPQSNEAAKKRIQSTVIALLIYIFAYAILNYLVPGIFNS